MKNKNGKQNSNETTNSIELAILNGLEAYRAQEEARLQRSAGQKNGEKKSQAGDLRSPEAMQEAGYKKQRRSRAKGKGTVLKPLSEGAEEPMKQSVPHKKNQGKEPSSVPVRQEGKKGKAPKKKPVKVLFFGGVGEIGKNMTALEYGNDIIVIDAGISFPTEDMPGIDLVFPDISYLVQNKHKIRGLFLTHGHEDHIGGVPYFLKELPSVPVYGTKLTLALVDNKLREHRLNNVQEHTVKPHDKVKAGAFTVNFVGVNHSIAGAVALAVETPYGIIFHSGDFKIDLTPVAGAPIDLEEIGEYGRKGVLLYLGESTNIERQGFTMSEKVVGSTLEHLFSAHADRRLIIATFASNVHRLQQIIDIAVKYRRKVAFSGRSMFNVVEAASKIGEITVPEGVLVDIEKSKNFFDREIVIVTTGSQGEPMSALTRMADGEFNKVTIGSNDTVIISASPIPGNERMVYRVINNLYKRGADVVYESLEKIHVSGHACQEEHKILHALLKPKFFIPVHGEYRHLKRHVLLAQEMGMSAAQTLIPEIGSCVLVTDDSLKQGESFQGGARLIDGAGIEDLGTSEVLKDRLLMSGEGVFIVSLVVSGGAVIGEPVIEQRGFVFSGERDYPAELADVVLRAIDGVNANGGAAEIKNAVRRAMKTYLYKKTKQSPMIVTIVNEV